MRLLEPTRAIWAVAVCAVLLGCASRCVYRWRQRRRWGGMTAHQRRTGWIRDSALAACAVLAVGFLTAALTRPQWPSERLRPTFDKQDLVLILDRSVSMRARDITPSRFARAVEEIQRFLAQRPATLDRVALVGFSGTSVVLSYPTSDMASLFFYLDWVRDDPAVLYGTDMGSAIETSLSLVARDTTPRPPPIFVLISDGDDQGTALERAVSGMRRAGIRLYAVGVGTTDPVSIPVQDEAGREHLLRDDDGRVLRTQFDPATLRRVAAMTGGQYVHSTGAGELRRALEAILDTERRTTGYVSEREYRDLYRWLLAGAAMSILGLVCVW